MAAKAPSFAGWSKSTGSASGSGWPTRTDVEFKRAAIPPEFYPPGGSAEESWRTLFYANLVSSFITEILADDGSNEGQF